MKKITIVIVVLLIFGALLAVSQLFSSTTLVENENRTVLFDEDALGVSLELADNWLENLQATTSVPLDVFLAERTDLSTEVQESLRYEGDLDPILCQTFAPARIGAKEIYVTDTAAQIMILARGDEKNPNMAIMTLEAGTEAWKINDISCSAGELPVNESEYTFVSTGRLVRESVPAPYDVNTWHVISIVDQSVQVVPLLFDSASVCLADAGETVCDPTVFTEGMVATVRGDMTEVGAIVEVLEQG